MTVLVSSLLILPFILYFVKTNSLYLNDVARFFFSSAAQTLGALIAIVLTALYFNITNLKPIQFSTFFVIPTNEIIKRLLVRDPFLKLSIFCGLVDILISLLFLLTTSGTDAHNYDSFFVILGMYLVLIFAVISVFSMYIFIVERASIYTQKNYLLIYLGSRKHLTLPVMIYYLELLIFNRIMNSSYCVTNCFDTFNKLSEKSKKIISGTISKNFLMYIDDYSLNDEAKDQTYRTMQEILFKFSHSTNNSNLVSEILLLISKSPRHFKNVEIFINSICDDISRHISQNNMLDDLKIRQIEELIFIFNNAHMIPDNYRYLIKRTQMIIKKYLEDSAKNNLLETEKHASLTMAIRW